jgi:hypothetical protein
MRVIDRTTYCSVSACSKQFGSKNGSRDSVWRLLNVRPGDNTFAASIWPLKDGHIVRAVLAALPGASDLTRYIESFRIGLNNTINVINQQPNVGACFF